MAVALVALLGADGKGCKCTPDPPSIDPPVEDTDADVADVADELQIVAVAPSYREAGEAFAARVDGAGFAEGAKVVIGQDIAPTDLRRDSANALRVTIPVLDAGSYDVAVVNPDGKRATLRRGLILTEPNNLGECGFTRLFFETDSDDLTGESTSVLDDKAACLNAKNTLRLEGHADERGTTSYNLGLGERRAYSVSRALAAKGVPVHKHSVVSYGEERPVDPGSSEAAWAKNRRVDIHAD